MYRQMICTVFGLVLAGPGFAQASNAVNDRYTSPVPALMGAINDGAFLSGRDHVTPTMKRQRTAQALELRTFVEQRKLANDGVLTEADHQEIARRYRRIIAIR